MTREVDDEFLEDLDLDVVEMCEGSFDECDPLVDRKRRGLVLRCAHDADDEAVEDLRGTPDHIDVAVRHRVV